MATISLPFGLSRQSDGGAVTDASEIDIVVDGKREHLDTYILRLPSGGGGCNCDGSGGGSSGGSTGGSNNGLVLIKPNNAADAMVVINIGDKAADNTQTVSASPKIIKIGDAAAENDGLATANDVKTYVGKVTDKALFYVDAADVIMVVEGDTSKSGETLKVIQI